MKLKDILQESGKDAFNRSLTREEKRNIMDSVSKFNEFGSRIYKTNEIAEMVEAIREMTKGASQLALQETDGWFDAVTVKRDMKEVATSTKLFEKAAKELSTLQQRLESVFEDIGNKLGKYYNISEAMDPVGKEDGDIDNDGDEDESDEYLAKKRAAISKAIKGDKVNENPALMALGRAAATGAGTALGDKLGSKIMGDEDEDPDDEHTDEMSFGANKFFESTKLTNLRKEAAPKMKTSKETENIKKVYLATSGLKKAGGSGRYGKEFEAAKKRALKAMNDMLTYSRIGG